MSATIPVILFAYSRPDHLRQTLDCLRDNNVPLIYVFSDGPRTPDKAPTVARVREMLRVIDRCEVVQGQPGHLQCSLPVEGQFRGDRIQAWWAPGELQH